MPEEVGNTREKRSQEEEPHEENSIHREPVIKPWLEGDIQVMNGGSIILPKEDLTISLLKIIEDLKKQVAQASKLGSSTTMEATHLAGEALALHMLEKEHSIRWRKQKLPTYDGKMDPEDHMHGGCYNTQRCIVLNVP